MGGLTELAFQYRTQGPAGSNDMVGDVHGDDGDGKYIISPREKERRPVPAIDCMNVLVSSYAAKRGKDMSTVSSRSKK